MSCNMVECQHSSLKFVKSPRVLIETTPTSESLACDMYACTANWAQISGERVQNYAIPDEGGASSPLFSPRVGMALTTTNTTAVRCLFHLFMVVGGRGPSSCAAGRVDAEGGGRGHDIGYLLEVARGTVAPSCAASVDPWLS